MKSEHALALPRETPLLLAQYRPSARPPAPRAAPPRVTAPPRIVVPLNPRAPNLSGRVKGSTTGRPSGPATAPSPPPPSAPPPPHSAGTVRPPSGPARVSLPDPAPLPPPRPFIAADLPDIRPNEVIAYFAAATPPGLPAQVAANLELQVLRETDLSLLGVRLVVFAFPADGRSLDDILAQIAADGRALQQQPNYYYTLTSDSGGMISSQYALAALKIEAAHETVRGNGIRVAVIDSKIDPDHPELSGAIAASFDAAGYGIADADKHGTSIAGIVGARGQLRGLAPAVSLIAVRAFWQSEREHPLASSSEVIARAIDWAVGTGGAQILNLSFAGPADALIERMIDAAVARGVIAVAAAGNAGPDAPPAYPAALPQVIAITAIDARDTLFAAANRGGYVDVAAPGVDILSPAPGGAYQVITGTSMAAAHVSGLAALVLEKSGGALTPAALQALLIATADDLGPAGRDAAFGAGRADGARALTQSAAATSAAAR